MAFVIPNQTSTSLLRPVPTPSAWTRPADWITITDTPGEVQFLMSDATSPYTAILTEYSGAGNIYIDWGDGTTTTISSGAATTTNKQYTSGGTPCSLGYNTWKIRVYGDVGTTLTNTRIVWNTNQTTLFIPSPSGVLEAVYGDGTQNTSLLYLFYSNVSTNPFYTFLTYVKLPSVYTFSGEAWFVFGACYRLRKVVMPTSAPNITSFQGLFTTCPILSEPIILPQDATLITSLNSAFFGCFNLTSITLPPTLNNITNMGAAFTNCYSLTQIQVPPTPLCLDYSSMLNNCRSLLSYEFKAFPTAPGTINMNNFLLNASSIEYIKLPATTSGNDVNMNGTFNSCVSLKNIVLPSKLNASNMTSTFQSCSSLASVVFPTTMSGLTNMTQTFQLCGTLQSITLPTSVGATINMTSTFNSCYALSEITIPSSYQITTLNGTFQNCFGLRNLVLPNNAQNSLTSMGGMCSSATNLQSVVMPTSMPLLNTLSTTFNSCGNLQSVVFPSSLNAVSNFNSTFAFCFNLNNITFPTSMTALTNISSTFQNCFSLKNVVLPQTTGNNTSYNTTFSACYSLTNITFPTTPSTALTSMASMITNCYSLSGMTNTQFLGNSATTTTTYVDFQSNTSVFQLPSLDLYCKFSRFVLPGAVGNLTKLTSLRLRNNGAGQYAGTSPQIDISYTSLGRAALVQVFNDLPTITAKTINITGSSGAAALTAGERAIATGKGWTITG